MKMSFRVFGVVVLALLGAWLWTIWFPSPQKIIRQRLEAVAKCVSFTPGEGVLVHLAALNARSAFGSLKVKFLEVRVTVAPDRQSASVNLTADADISDQRDAFVQEIKILLRKIDGEWLITRVETLRTVSILDFEPAHTLSIVDA
jgi:hypothetical protein